MTPAEFESLKHGLQADGWLANQALLIWGTNEKGERRDLIIDGEHRWRAAIALQMVQGPMVVLDNVTEAQAKALTIKMNRKRGKFQDDLLAQVVRSIEKDAAAWTDNLGLDLGFSDEEIAKMLAAPAVTLEGPTNAPPRPQAPPQGDLPSGLPPTSMKLVQVHLSGEEHPKFDSALRVCAEHLGTSNASDTIFKAVLAFAQRLKEQPGPAAAAGA